MPATPNLPFEGKKISVSVKTGSWGLTVLTDSKLVDVGGRTMLVGSDPGSTVGSNSIVYIDWANVALLWVHDDKD